MTLIPQVDLPDHDKVETLRELDQFRHWRSLDDERYCLVCGKIITGRQIKVVGDKDQNGRLQLRCPTEQCSSIPMDWILPTDEVLASAKAQTVPIEQSNIGVSGSPDPVIRERVALSSRKLAFRFKQLFRISRNYGLGSHPLI